MQDLQTVYPQDRAPLILLESFTTKWHGISEGMHHSHFNEYCSVRFQEDLEQLQSDLAPYVAKFLKSF
jgi:hypothetical protein